MMANNDGKSFYLNAIDPSETMADKIKLLIYNRSGIEIQARDAVRFNNIINKKLNSLNLKNENEYYNLLLTDSQEFEQLIDDIVIRETYFYRTPSHFDVFLNVLKKNLKQNYTIWSAGCSIGAEPYTFALLIAEHMGEEALNSLNIIATDLSSKSVKSAKDGIFSPRCVKTVPPKILNQYFSQKDNFYYISENIKNSVSFKQHNLLENDYPSNVDVVFCRNVMIYFSPQMRLKVIKKIYNALNDNGILLLGHSESIRDYSDLFSTQWAYDTFYYRKQTNSNIINKKNPPKIKKDKIEIKNTPSTRIFYKKDTSLIRKEKQSDFIDVIEIEGIIEKENASNVLKNTLLKLLSQSPTKVILDMSNVELLDKLGLAMIQRGIRHFTKNGGLCVFVTNNPQIIRWLEKAGFEFNKNIFETEQLARKYYERIH